MTNTRIGHLLAAAREQALQKRLDPIAERLVQWRPLPPILLLAALSTVFIFANDRGVFYRPGHHNDTSMQTLSIATNLSPEHNFLLFHHRNEKGYRAYSRFPVANYAIVKLAILPFSPDLSSQIHAARVAMILFFIGSGLLAYFALNKIFQNRWACLASVALAFSSTYILYYNDIISAEHMTNVFGIFLVLHGVAVFVQDGKFRQLLIKTCIALFLGWHVYALLIPFILFGIIRSIIQWRKQESRGVKQIFIQSIRNRFLILGMTALFVGGILISFNIITEYVALSERHSFRNLPTIDSLTYRIGLDQDFNEEFSDQLDPLNFTIEQIYRIGGMMVPFGIPGFTNRLGLSSDAVLGSHGVILGAASLFLALIILIRTRHKIILFPLAAMGFVWSFPLRNQTAFHDVETIFYIGIPLIIISFILLHLKEMVGERYMAIISLVSLCILCFSIAQMARIGISPVESGRQHALFTDIDRIQDAVMEEKVIFFPENYNALHIWAFGFYFPRNIATYNRDIADYAISREKILGITSLISNSTSIFLYTAEEYNMTYNDVIAQITATVRRFSMEDPAIDLSTSEYDVYLENNSLWYLRSGPCDVVFNDRGVPFFLHVMPSDTEDLPSDRKEHGFSGLDFIPEDHWLDILDFCVIERRLPQYDIAAIRTGQYDSRGELWSGDIRIAEPE